MSVPGPIEGPFVAWVSGAEVAACCQGVPDNSETAAVLEEAAAAASQLAYELSARQFPGLSPPVKVRPCRQTCSCFGTSPSLGVGMWYWTSSWYGGVGWTWRNECGERCGCGTAEYVRLAGYPVREIVEVKIDGGVVDPATYALSERTDIIRLSDPGPPPVQRSWPDCQDLTLDDDQPGTFSVVYTWGVDPPLLGVLAVSALACELAKGCLDLAGAPCKLPARATKVVRQGITYERLVPLAELLMTGATGILSWDSFMAAYNPSGLGRRPAVFSPDVQPYAQRQWT